MLTKVRLLIDNHHMLNAGDKVLAACSGGPDSLALVHSLALLRSEYGIEVFVAHVDHMFRGEESAEDARFVASFCREQGLICYQKAIDVPAFIQKSGLSSQQAARQLRYQYLHEVAQQLGGAKIATGHHQDDQAETVLLHFLRGSGSMGLRGILPLNERIIRPLLGVSRQEVLSYCEAHQLKFRLDSSNLKTDYLRNRIRLELMPILEQQYNPAVKEALSRTAQVLGDEHDFIRKSAAQLWDEAVTEEEGGLFVPAEPVVRQHRALQREFFRLVIEKKQGNVTGIAFHHVENLIQLMHDGRVGAVLELPGFLFVQKTYRGLLFYAKTIQNKEVKTGIGTPGCLLTVPGVTAISALQLTVTAEQVEAPFQPNGIYGIFDWDCIKFPLYLRTRQEGDRFYPAGSTGSKKLKDFFIDNKIPRQARDSIPLVCDQSGILWVAGYRQAERGKVTEKTQKILLLHINKQGEQR